MVFKIQIVEDEKMIPFEEITQVLNESYKSLTLKNLNYKATTQSVEDTKQRIDGGLCTLAYYEGKLVGTMTSHIVQNKKRKWYEDKKYISITQLAVLPEYRDKGVLIQLVLYFKRNIIKKDTSIESLICDTAVNAKHLVEAYLGLGAQIVDYVSWSGTNYYSYVMRYAFTGKKYSDRFCKYKLCLAKFRCHLLYTKEGNRRKIFRIIRSLN